MFSNEDKAIKILKIASGGDYKFMNRVVHAIEVECIVGGVNLDFRGAIVQGDTLKLNVITVAGGVDITVPQHWSVSFETTSVFGGIEDNRMVPETIGEPIAVQLVITGSIMLGGIRLSS